MGEVRRPAKDIGREVRAFRQGRKWAPRKNPCERPPGQPDFAGQPGPMDFEVRFRVREAKTHLEYYGYAVWNEQTVDSNGLPGDFDVDRYHLQWKVTTDAAGNNYAHENGEKVRGQKTVHVAEDNKTQTIEVTGASGGTFKISVGGSDTPNINWNATAAQVKTALSGVGGLTAGEITESGGPLGTNPVTLDFSGDNKTTKLVISDDDLTGPNPTVTTQVKDKYRVDFGRMWQPRRLYVSARLRVRAGAGCWSDWSAWTTPVHPVDATTEPRPPIPNNTTLDFDHLHSSRFDPLRAIVSGDYVGFWDVPGGDQEDDMARYHVQLQWSNDNGTTWHWPPKKHSVRDKDDNDNRWRSVFHNIDRRKLYRYRVSSEDRYNRRGDWGPGASNANARLDGWSAAVDPKTFDEAPPAPTFITADVDRARVTLEVDDYGAAWKGKIDYYEWEVYYDSVTDPNRQARDRMHRGLTKRFTLRKPKGHTVIARVRAYTASDEASGWAQVTCSAATPPLPAIGAASFDADGPKHSRYRAIVPVSVNDVGHNDNVQKVRVQLVHKTVAGNPSAGNKKMSRNVRMNDDPNEAVFSGIPRNHYTYVRAQSVDGDDKESAWTAWTSMGRPRDSGPTTAPSSPTGVTINDTQPRRIVARWPDPDDDETTSWQVTVKKGGGTVEGPVTVRNNKYVYRVPKADVGANHDIEVRAVSQMGGVSGIGTAGGVPNDEDISGAGWDVGDIKKKGTAPVPAKWLRCNGNGYSTSAYPELFAAIGYSYGGSGATFNVPDMNRRHGMGHDDSSYPLGASDGELESVRTAVHQHNTDNTATPVDDDQTDGFPGADYTAGYPDGDYTGGQPDGDYTTEPNDHTHPAGNLSNDSNPNTVQKSGSGTSAAGPSHSHNISGSTDGRQAMTHHHNGHNHNSHHHNGHGHGGHHHNGHGHGGHKHGHKHGAGGHGHGHGHDNKKRPHLAVKYIIKAMS